LAVPSLRGLKVVNEAHCSVAVFEKVLDPAQISLLSWQHLPPHKIVAPSLRLHCTEADLQNGSLGEQQYVTVPLSMHNGELPFASASQEVVIDFPAHDHVPDTSVAL